MLPTWENWDQKLQIQVPVLLELAKHVNSDKLHAFYISKTFISNASPKLTKNQADAKQHPEVKLLLFTNYSHSSCENFRIYSRK